MYFVYLVSCVCICYLSLPLFAHSVLSLSPSPPLPGRLSAGWFLLEPGPAQGLFLLKGSFSLLTWGFWLWVSASWTQLYRQRRCTNE